MNNGGCEQTCSNGECSCSEGYTLKLQGNCVGMSYGLRDIYPRGVKFSKEFSLST